MSEGEQAGGGGDGEGDGDGEGEGDGDKEACGNTVISLSPGAASTGKKKKKKNATQRYRQKRRETSAKRESEHGIKPVSLAHAQSSQCFQLPSFDAASLPVASTGWSGSTSKDAAAADAQEHWKDLNKLLREGSMTYVDWDGM